MEEDEGALIIADSGVETEPTLVYDQSFEEVTNETQDGLTLHCGEESQESQDEIQDILNSCTQGETPGTAQSIITFYGASTSADTPTGQVQEEDSIIKFEEEEQDPFGTSEDTSNSDTFKPPSRRSTFESSVTSEVDSEDEENSLESDGGSPYDEIEPGSFKCRFCPRKFKLRVQATRHVATEHEVKKTRDCRFCFIKFRYRRQRLEHELTTHRQNLTANELAQYPSCSSCGKEFVKHAAARHHIQQVHSGIGEVIDNRSKLLKAAHDATVEAKPAKIPSIPDREGNKCRFCRYICKTPTAALLHEIRLHREAIPAEELSNYPACNECGILNTSRIALTTHMRNCHRPKPTAAAPSDTTAAPWATTAATIVTTPTPAAVTAANASKPPVQLKDKLQTEEIRTPVSLAAIPVVLPLPAGMHNASSETFLACGSCGIVLPSNQLVVHMTQLCPMSAIATKTALAVAAQSRLVQKYRCSDCDGEFFHEEAYQRHRRRRHPQVVVETVAAPPIKIEPDCMANEDAVGVDAFEAAEQYETMEQDQDETEHQYHEEETPEVNHQETVANLHPKQAWFDTQKSAFGIKCPQCPKMLNSLQALALHEEWHDADEIDRCKYCDQVYTPSTRFHLQSHVLDKHPEKAEQNQTKTSGPPAKRKRRSSTVEESDEDYDPIPAKQHRKFYCRKCNKQLSQQVSYDIHMFRLHPESFDRSNRTIHNCDICNQEFLFSSQLRQHKERSHSNSSVIEPRKQISSPEYSPPSYNPPEETNSPEVVDDVEREPEPPEASQRNLNHKKILIGPNTIQDNTCPVCLNKYSAKWFTESHAFRSHPEQFDRSQWTVYNCRVCREEYIHKHLFRRHLREHGLDPDAEGILTNGKWHRRIPQNKVVETVQKKPQNTNGRIMVSKIKDAKCPVCFKQYACNWSAEEHAFRNHRDQFDTSEWNMFVCRICQEEYLHNHLFRKHLRSHGLDPDKEGFPSSYIQPIRTERNADAPAEVDHISASGLTCTICSKTYTVRWAVEDHIFRIHPDKFDRTGRTIYSCQMCDKEFIHKHKYRVHLKGIHGCDPYQTETSTLQVGNSRPSTGGSLIPNEDSLSQSPVGNEADYCEINEEFGASVLPDAPEPEVEEMPTISLLETPEVIEEIPTIDLLDTSEVSEKTGTRSSGMTCPVCSKTYSVSWAVDDHIFKKHPEHFDRTGWKIYTCHVCNEELIHNHLFRNHLRRDHGLQPEEIEAATAQYGTTTRSYARKAIVPIAVKDDLSEIIAEDTEAANICEVVPSFEGLVRPGTLQSGNCPACAKSFTKKINVEEHIIKVHPEIIDREAWTILTCRVCLGEFLHNSVFRAHLRTHNLDPDEEGYPVSEHSRRRLPQAAPKRSRRRYDSSDDSDYEYTVKRHPPPRHGGVSGPLKCIFCDVTFTQNHARHQHTFRFHRHEADWTGWTIYTCHDCPEEYVYKSQLRQHCRVKNHKGWFGDGDDGGNFATANPGIRRMYQDTRESSAGSPMDVLMDSSSMEFPTEASDTGNQQFPATAVNRAPPSRASATFSSMNRIQCQYCSNSYTQNWCLRAHMFKDHREHMDLTAVPIHTCGDCGIEYIYRSQLTQHCRKSSHTPAAQATEQQQLEFDHPCNTCGLSFPSFSAFSQHYMEAHVNPLVFDDGTSIGCRFCTSKFDSSEQRNQHEDEDHPDLVEVLGPCPS